MDQAVVPLAHASQQLGQQERSGKNVGRDHFEIGVEEALSKAVLTLYDTKVFRSNEDWRREFEKAVVHVQWDPERSLRGAALDHYSIQVGISRHLIRDFVEKWILKIEDISPVVAKIRGLLRSGNVDAAKRHLPTERVYSLPEAIARRLLIM